MSSNIPRSYIVQIFGNTELTFVASGTRKQALHLELMIVAVAPYIQRFAYRGFARKQLIDVMTLNFRVIRHVEWLHLCTQYVRSCEMW